MKKGQHDPITSVNVEMFSEVFYIDFTNRIYCSMNGLFKFMYGYQ